MPKIVDHDAYREELVEGAARLYGERGVGAVSMRQLADELGVSTGTLYHYFGSKEELFGGVVRHVVERDRAILEQAFAAVADGPPATVEQLFGFLLTRETEQMQQFVVLMDFWRLHPDQRKALAPVLRDAHYAYANLAAALLGADDTALGEVVVSVLFNILESRWFHGESFDHGPQLERLQQLVDLVRAQDG